MKNYYEEYWQREHLPTEGDPLASTRAALVWKQLEAAGVTSGALVDAGSGEGTFVADATARGFDAIGIELSEHAIARAREQNPNCTYRAHSVEDLPWPVDPGSVDVVVSFEVIEHLLQPRLLVQGAVHVLRPGGYLAISTPYHGFLKNLAISLVAFDQHFAVEGDHIRFFSDAALRGLLVRNGFETERILHYGRFRGLWAGSLIWARKACSP
jgi:2-polyprenyl-3-methyl-5-hydroxy-6-metoxy-1,4-benzoquinol methylase